MKNKIKKIIKKNGFTICSDMDKYLDHYEFFISKETTTYDKLSKFNYECLVQIYETSVYVMWANIKTPCSMWIYEEDVLRIKLETKKLQQEIKKILNKSK